MCSRTLHNYAWGLFHPPPVADKRRKITVAGTRVNTFFDQSKCTSISETIRLQSVGVEECLTDITRFRYSLLGPAHFSWYGQRGVPC